MGEINKHLRLKTIFFKISLDLAIMTSFFQVPHVLTPLVQFGALWGFQKYRGTKFPRGGGAWVYLAHSLLYLQFCFIEGLGLGLGLE